VLWWGSTVVEGLAWAVKGIEILAVFPEKAGLAI